MRVIVTRPAHEGAAWVQRLRNAGVDAHALPLIAIAPVPDPSALTDAWCRLGHWRAVMFVSSNAVTGFFAARDGAAWPPATRAWAPGPGTAAAVMAQGVPAGQVDSPAPDAPQFDSEALWQRVAGHVQTGDSVLLVRGAGKAGSGEGRDALARRLRTQGVQVDEVLAYQRAAPVWSAAERALAQQAAVDGSCWLFSSTQALRHLQALLPGTDWSRTPALATHPRITKVARHLGFTVVQESRPAFDDVLASIESAR